MKHIISVLSFLICVITVQSQIPIPKVTTGAVVPLEEWTLIKGWMDSTSSPADQYGIGGIFSTIPNFKDVTGKNLVVMNYYDYPRASSHDRTWSFLYPRDTTDQFSWQPGWANNLINLDINGDHVDDYLSSAGLILGRVSDYPDTTTVYDIRSTGRRAGSKRNTYGDINEDGKDDLFYYKRASIDSPVLLTISFGSDDVKSLKTTSVISSKISDSTVTELAVVMYKNKGGSWRLITYTWASIYVKSPPGKSYGLPEKAGIHLYEVEVKKSSDSSLVSLLLLDTFRDADWDFHSDEYYINNWSPLVQNGAGTIFNSSHLSSIFFYPYVAHVSGTAGNYKLNFTNPVLDVTQDRFKQINSTDGCPDCWVLDHSIDGDSVEDLCYLSFSTVFFYSVDLLGIPHQRFGWTESNDRHSGGITSVYSVGDFTGDGLSEVAVLVNDDFKGNTFAVLKGQDWSLVSVPSESRSILKVSSPYPTPTKKEHVVIPIWIDRDNNYELSLYSIDGKVKNIVLSTYLTSGSHNIDFNTTPYSSGTYILRLTDDRRSVESTFQLTR